MHLQEWTEMSEEQKLVNFVIQERILTLINLMQPRQTHKAFKPCNSLNIQFNTWMDLTAMPGNAVWCLESTEAGMWHTKAP